MKANVGSADRIIRFILGVIILALGFYFKSWWGIVGIVPIITGFLNFCPAYSLIGVSTKKKIETEKLKI
ncbi:MAG: DUF2892 domain-containing protein [Ignavibacteriales bacterium]|jgi:hypothetical protein|nr:DUF2892 domain-containing protein [Ignavibacteriales bacterium]MBP9121000.1 DUF2892 domain-containing protein [Ignavibacterium sp.]RPI61993.1 MAG: DUF2892 domain-containing protein [Ignavibacteriales bacterium]